MTSLSQWQPHRISPHSKQWNMGAFPFGVIGMIYEISLWRVGIAQSGITMWWGSHRVSIDDFEHTCPLQWTKDINLVSIHICRRGKAQDQRFGFSWILCNAIFFDFIPNPSSTTWKYYLLTIVCKSLGDCLSLGDSTPLDFHLATLSTIIGHHWVSITRTSESCTPLVTAFRFHGTITWY